MDYFKEIDGVIDYIERNIYGKISIEDIMKNVNCSMPHFYRIFYHVVGDTIMGYVRKRKLSCASMELINTSKSIIDIALDYGYESQQAFTRAFTNTFGISPGRYRQTGTDIAFYPRINVYERKLQMSGIRFENVKIIVLEPMKVASCHVYESIVKSGNFENIISKAWKGLIDWQLGEWGKTYFQRYGHKLPKMKIAKWAVDNNFHIPPNTRYFGFENPWPTADEQEYGYEAWAVINHDAKASGNMTIKNFDGGLYATVSATYGNNSNIKEAWQILHAWLRQSNYTYGDHQWLEEHITIPGTGGFHGFNLFMAIKEK